MLSAPAPKASDHRPHNMRLNVLTPAAFALPLLLISPATATTQATDTDALRERVATQFGGPGSVQLAVVDAAVRLASQSGSRLLYVVTAGDARRNRELTGPSTVDVQGVPAQPVDSGVHDGVGHEKLSYAAFWAVVDPVANTGFVHARWRDSHGMWSYSRHLMVPPPHPTALRVGGDATLTEFITDGVQTHGYQHGNTGAGGPLMPSIFQHLACYGPTQVKLNGVPFVNPFPGATAPDWFGAMKVTDGVRDEIDGTVRNSTGGLFSPLAPGDGATDADDLEVQLIFHDDALPKGSSVANFPPRHRFFYWINFEQVRMRVLHL